LVTEQSDKKRIDFDPIQVAAGSLASVTAAVAASELGVAGTLIGAAVGSVVGALAGTVYEHYIDRTQDHVRTLVPRRTADHPPTDHTATTTTTATTATTATARPAWLRSGRLALVGSAAVGLGIALVALTGFEAVTGQPIGAGEADGGTSIGRAFGGRSSAGTGVDPSSTPSPEVTVDGEPTSTPAQSEPSPSPTTTAPTLKPSAPSTSPTTTETPQPLPPNG
jgi:hypothetical protein